MISLIEGQNSPQARRTGATELLRQQWPEVSPNIVRILSGPNKPARIAVAEALAALPQAFHADFLEPLLAMLADTQPQARSAAQSALAVCNDQRLIPRLRSAVLGDGPPPLPPTAALDTLGQMTSRDAVAVLVDALANAPLRSAALNALEHATALEFKADADAARAWWDGTREISDQRWQAMQIERLARRNRTLAQRLRDVETRLSATLRERYVRAAEKEHAALLTAFLSDPSTSVRLMGLELMQAEVVGGKTIGPDAAARTRALLNAPETSVRAAAVRTVAGLRDSADAPRLIAALSSERADTVRRALVNALGYVGGGDAVESLVKLLAEAGSEMADEAATALGRLAERGVLQDGPRDTVAQALRAKLSAKPDDRVYERLLWAMSRVADPRCGQAFVAALHAKSVPVRLAAVRGTGLLAGRKEDAPPPAGAPATEGVLSHAALCDALAAAIGDSDAGVRRAIVDALTKLATSTAQRDALWTRISTQAEPDAAIRNAAWRGLLDLLQTRPITEIEQRIAALPDEPARPGRTLELLRLMESRLAADAAKRGELGALRARIAAQFAASAKLDDAIKTYLQALQDLHAAGSKQIPRVSIELLRLALLNGRYSADVAAALANGNPALDGAAVWERIRADVEARLNRDGVDRAIAILAGMMARPPASMPAKAQTGIEAMLANARELRIRFDREDVDAALLKLRANPTDEAAKASIVALGERALPALDVALRALLAAKSPNAEAERLIHDLLRAIKPDWPGFAPDAVAGDKLKALDALHPSSTE